MFTDMRAHYDPQAIQARRALIDGGPLLPDERRFFDEGCQFIARLLPDEPALIAAKELPQRRMKNSLWTSPEEIIAAIYYWDSPQLMLNPEIFGRRVLFINSILHEGKHRLQHLAGTEMMHQSWIGSLEVRSAIESEAYQFQIERGDVIAACLRRQGDNKARELADALDSFRPDILEFVERWSKLNSLVRKHRAAVEKAGRLITNAQRAHGNTDVLIDAMLDTLQDEPVTDDGQIIIATTEALQQRTQTRLNTLFVSVSEFVSEAQPLLRALGHISQ